MPIFLIVGYIKLNDIIDVSIYNSFFAIKVHYWCYFSALFTFMIGINYFMLHWAKKKTIQILSLFHIIFQIEAIIPFFIALFMINSKTSFSPSNPFSFIDFYEVLTISFFIYLASIFIHLINFFSSLFLRRR